jgi:hypothetical protein
MPLFCDKLCDSDVEALEAIRAACHALLPSWQNPEQLLSAAATSPAG